jgi:hypothetical protein
LKPNQFPEAIEGITTGGGGGEKPFDCHSVTFVYGDKSYVRSVADGDTCADPVERGLIPTPTKESTAQYNYTYYGWGASDGGAADANILKNITSDKTVYAIFTATVRYYTITWLDDDGVTVLKEETLAYGKTPSYTPTKDGYIFFGWTPSVSLVTGDTTYTAVWEEASVKHKLENGTLTIYGKGDMDNYSPASRPAWYDNASEISAIVIEDGITGIGDYAFYQLSGVTSVAIADTVTKIGDSAFSDCSGLLSIEVPNSVISIGIGCFNMCSALTSVVLPDGISEIKQGTFQNCYELSIYNIPDSVTKIGAYAFYGAGNKCATAYSITIPENVKSIGQRAFGAAKLSSVTFEDPDGWYVNTSSSATSGTNITLTDPVTNATYLVKTSTSSPSGYANYYWFNT